MITRRLTIFPLATGGFAAAEVPQVQVKHLDDDNDGGLIQARFDLGPKHEDAVRAVPGIEHYIRVSRYEAAVYKGVAFTWAEVKPAILAALKGVQ